MRKPSSEEGTGERAEISALTQMAGAVDDVRKPGTERRIVAIFATPVDPQIGLRPPDEEMLRHLADRTRQRHSNPNS